MMPADHAQRERALDASRSFIVQAPAGSGKTELLIQRYLRLLGLVSRPESVVAITFTRKAAAEMLRRVLHALAEARGPEPEQPHKRRTWELARAVLRRAEAEAWDIEANPSRLAIQTIDSLCLSLVSRMPWLSRLGPRLEMVDDASDMFAEAALRTVELLETDRYAEPMERLLRHLDNRQSRLAKLFAAMLGHREQWLRHIVRADPAWMRERFEAGLRRRIEAYLENLRAAAPQAIVREAPELLRHAAANLRGSEKNLEIQACADLTALPSAQACDLPYWTGLAALLLTGGGEVRKKVDKSIGFPTHSRLKPSMTKLLDSMRGYDAFVELLAGVSNLPAERFEDSQWEVLEALLRVLPAAAAELRLVFSERGIVDFSTLNEAALVALGEDESPTDLALALDYRIQHLLVDEFQDTSYSQMRLLEKLTLGWTPGDGRTLFLVGDPMQSIYRFREAEVGLFLRTVRNGLPAVEIEPLTLTVNFRSRSNIVDWVNEVFPDVFVKEEDIALGAVVYSPSVCASEDPPGPDVTVHPFWDPAGVETEGQPAAEAARVRAIVEGARSEGKSVAVLARARGHLPHILAELRAAGLRYRAVELDPLGSSPAVLDLMALTAAMLHPADRLSWLAILRAPWCGLSLADLHALVSDRQNAVVADLLADPERLARLSADGRRRVERLRAALAAPRQRTLRAWVEGVWLRLGGPATVRDAAGLVDAEAYLDLLDKLDEGCDVDLEALRLEVGRLFAAPDPGAGDGLEIMTIHKAKGLEFDVVIVPGLGRTAKTDDERLMLWLENPSPERAGESELLLAPMRAAAGKPNAIYQYIQKLESEKEKHERARLLYVAVTRARSELHLLGATRLGKNGEVRKPSSKTLLGMLWQTAEPYFRRPATLQEEPAPAAGPAPNLRRLAADWDAPPLADAAQAAGEGFAAYRWRAQRRRIVGTVVHDVLQEIGREGAQAWNPARIRVARPRFEAALRCAGMPDEDLPEAAGTVEQALLRALQDERGRWILDGAHLDAWSEVALAGVVDGCVVERRVDRTFVDEKGVRWIIDFKTGYCAEKNREGFLAAQMELYRRQMEDYRALYRRLEKRPVRIGLYFPLLGAWREYEESAVAAGV